MVVKLINIWIATALNFNKGIAIFIHKMHSGHKQENLKLNIVLQDINQGLDFTEISACPREKDYFFGVIQNLGNLNGDPPADRG